MRTIVVAPEAERDIDSIWDYIASDNLDAADRVRNQIKAEIRKLADQPGIGHSRQDLPDRRYRAWKIYSYLIIYRFDAGELLIVRVIHGARDIGAIMRQDMPHRPPGGR